MGAWSLPAMLLARADCRRASKSTDTSGPSPKVEWKRGGTPEETALREVFQETGYRAAIVGEVSGVFAGGASTNRYYLMVPAGAPEPFDPRETEEVR